MAKRCKYFELIKRPGKFTQLEPNAIFCGNQPIFVRTPGVVTRPVPDGVVDFPAVVVGMLLTVGPSNDKTVKRNMRQPNQFIT